MQRGAIRTNWLEHFCVCLNSCYIECVVMLCSLDGALACAVCTHSHRLSATHSMPMDLWCIHCMPIICYYLFNYNAGIYRCYVFVINTTRLLLLLFSALCTGRAHLFFAVVRFYVIWVNVIFYSCMRLVYAQQLSLAMFRRRRRRRCRHCWPSPSTVFSFESNLILASTTPFAHDICPQTWKICCFFSLLFLHSTFNQCRRAAYSIFFLLTLLISFAAVSVDFANAFYFYFSFHLKRFLLGRKKIDSALDPYINHNYYFHARGGLLW